MGRRLKWAKGILPAVLATSAIWGASSLAHAEIGVPGPLMALDGSANSIGPRGPGRVPIEISLQSHIFSRSGARPPGFTAVEVAFDKRGAVDLVGLPGCRWSTLRTAGVATVRKACRSAIVGTGSAEILGEGDPAPATTVPLTLFNRPASPDPGHTPSLFLHASGLPGKRPVVAVVVDLEVLGASSTYGLNATIDIPRSVLDGGAITAFDLEMGRLFRHRERERGFATAPCGDEPLFARATAVLSNGDTLVAIKAVDCR